MPTTPSYVATRELVASSSTLWLNAGPKMERVEGELKEAIRAASDGDVFAVCDRNNHDDVWRLVRLQFLADEPLEKQWRLF